MFKNVCKRLQDQRGFTLIELMIVIAVIAILAAVLIPRGGMIQDTAKEAGVEANARTVQGVVEGLAHRFDTGAALRAAVDARLGDSVKNPFSHSTVTGTAWSPPHRPAVHIFCTMNGALPDPWPSNHDNGHDRFEGVVMVHIPDTPGDITITPYGKGDGENNDRVGTVSEPSAMPIPGAQITVEW